MVTTFYPPYNFGGDGMFVYRLSEELARRGHSVEVVHCIDAYESVASGRRPSVGGFPTHANVTVHRLKSRLGVMSPLITHQTGRSGLKAGSLKRILDHGEFDVIHYHNMSLIGAEALGYGSAIKLYTMHEHWLVCPTHVLWKFDKEPCEQKSCVACTIRQKRPPQLWRKTGYLDSMLEHVDAFIALSEFSRGKHEAMGFRTEAPVTVIPPLIPHPALEDTEPSEPREPYFLYVGRLEKMKGVQALLGAFRRYRGADLLIAGNGDYAGQLREQAKYLPHVHFLGSVPYDQLEALYRRALAALVPTIGYETFGIVMAEAFAHGTPAIVNDTGPLPEIACMSDAAIQYGNEDELVAALEAMASDETMRQELGAKGHEAYLNHYTPERHLEHYFRLIEQITVGKGLEWREFEAVS